MKNLIVYGDQLVASPGAYHGFNVQPGEHWWELLAEEMEAKPVLLDYRMTSLSSGVSPLYYASKVISSNFVRSIDNFFISVVPSSNRSLNWDVNGPIHNVTENPGPHIIPEYCDWQSDFTYNILDLSLIHI